jgi:signal transduction histidine kinase
MLNPAENLVQNLISRLSQKVGRSLFSQMLLAVLSVLLLAQIVTFGILSVIYSGAISEVNESQQIQKFVTVVETLERAEGEQDYGSILNPLNNDYVRYSIQKRMDLTSVIMNESEQAVVNKITAALGQNYQGRVWVKQERQPMLMSGALQNANERNDKALTELRIAVHLQNDRWLQLNATSSTLSAIAIKQGMTFFALATLLTLACIAVMIKKITKPLQLLSQASQQLGRGDVVEPIAEQGSDDITETIRAFNQMNQRVQRFGEDRARLLAALSHDLRTPITSMLLRVEMMPDNDDRDALLKTLEEMQLMSESTLSFMKQSSDTEATQPVEVNAFLGSLSEDLVEVGYSVEFKESDSATLPCRPVSLKRALRNLIENGAKYGAHAEVSFFTPDQSSLIIEIQDSGDGIPEEKFEQVFEPFYRLETSRNRETGGTGLGMAIARNIIRSHGGNVELSNQQAGLLVRVELPT